MYRAFKQNLIKMLAFAAVILALLVCLRINMSTVYGSGSGNLTVHTKYEDTDISGVSVHIYAVSELAEEGIVDSQASDSDAVKIIADQVNSGELSEYSNGTTGSDGRIDFNNVPDGSYFIKCDSIKKDKTTYSFQDSLISMPYFDAEGNSTYEVTVVPKVEVITEAEDPETYYVYKRWSDSGHTKKRPSEITVYIYLDGSLYNTVKLNSSNSWQYSWSYEKGHTWSVAEESIKKYRTVIDSSGTSFTITNTYKSSGGGGSSDDDDDDDDDGTVTTTSTTDSGTLGSASDPISDAVDAAAGVLGDMEAGVLGDRLLPQTGQLWWPLPVLILLGIIFFVVGVRMNRNEE